MIGPKVKFVLTYIFLKKTHFRWYSDPLKIPIIHATLQHTLMANLPSISIHPIIYVYCLCSMFIKSVSTKYMYYILLDWLNFDHQHTLFSIHCWSLSWKRHEFGPVSQKRYIPQCVWNEKIITKPMRKMDWGHKFAYINRN